MSDVSDLRKSLVDVDDSVLLVIDIQDYFLQKLDRAKSEGLVAKVVWLLHVARHLGVPVVAMAEDMDRTGPLHSAVHDALPPGAKIHNKDFFGLAANPEILEAVNATGCKTAVCVGMETDVCVAQSAIGLVGEGYKVVTLQDAVASMDADEAVGLARMREAGVVISSVKALYYEWLRSVSRTQDLRRAAPELEKLRPANLIL